MAGDPLGRPGPPPGAGAHIGPGAGASGPQGPRVATPSARGRSWLPLAGVGLAAAEVAAFVGVAQLIGYPLSVVLVLAASLAGLVLVRREGLRAWRGFRDTALAGTPPGRQVTDGLVGLGGALLLAAPGLVTGVTGVALLTPPVRRLARGRVQARAERRMSSAQAGEVFGPRRIRVEHDEPAQTAETEVVEGEIIDRRDG